MHLGILIAFLLLFSSVLKVFECSCLVFSLALFIAPLAPFLNLIKFSIFMPPGPWAALPLLTSPVSSLVLLLQMLCVPQSQSDVFLGSVSWKGLCACSDTLPVIPFLVSLGLLFLELHVYPVPVFAWWACRVPGTLVGHWGQAVACVCLI